MALRRMEDDDPMPVGITVTLASDCCQAAVLVGSSAAGGHRCSQCREECLTARYQVTEDLSACCGAPVTVGGRTTRYYACTGCGQACDLTTS